MDWKHSIGGEREKDGLAPSVKRARCVIIRVADVTETTLAMPGGEAKQAGSKARTCSPGTLSGIDLSALCAGSEDPGALKLDATKSLSQSQGAHGCQLDKKEKIANRPRPRTRRKRHVAGTTTWAVCPAGKYSEISHEGSASTRRLGHAGSK